MTTEKHSQTPLLVHSSSSSSHKVSLQTWEIKECQCCILRICNILPIFHPFGQFKMIWDPMLIVVLIVSAIEIPFTLVFTIELTLRNFTGIMAFAIDIFLCIDIMINFRTAYFDEFDPLQLITSPKYIAKKYLKTRFLFDFITSFPFEFVFNHSSTQNIAEYVQAFRVLRIIRLLKVVRIIKMMRLFDKLPKRLSISPEYIIYIKILKVFFGMILGAHYFACIWWETGKLMHQQGYPSWIEQVDEIKYPMSDGGIFKKYTYAYYWSIVTLFTTGFGDIVARNVIECWVSVFCIVVGTVYMTYLIGLATAFVAEGDHIKRIEAERLKHAMIFCEHHDLSDKLSHAVEAHIKYHHTYNYVMCDAEKDVLDHLPKHLRKDIHTEIANKTLKNVDFLSEYLPLDLIGHIAIKMKSISCNSGHWLFCKNDIANELYIQRTGVSMIYYHNHLDESKDKRNHTTKRGDMIGEEALFLNKRKHSLKSLTWSEYYVLKIEDIKHVIFSNYVHGDKIWNKIQHKAKVLNGKYSRNVYQTANADGFEIIDAININDTQQMYKHKHMIHDLSNQAFDLKKKYLMRPELEAEVLPPYSSLNDEIAMSITNSFNSLDAEIMNHMVRNSSSSRIRLNSDNRNEAVLNHYQHIHLKTQLLYHKGNNVDHEMIETDESTHTDHSNHEHKQEEDEFEMVTLKQDSVVAAEGFNDGNVEDPKFSTKSVDYTADETLWSD